MPPIAHLCDEHNRRLAEAEARLERGDVILKTVRRIEVAVCGDPDMGIEGLATLPRRVQRLERSRVWLLGAASVTGFTIGSLIPILLQIFPK